MDAERKLTLSEFIERMDKLENEHDMDEVFDFSKLNMGDLMEHIDDKLTAGESSLIEIWAMANMLGFECIHKKNQQIAEKAIIKAINIAWKYVAENCKTENYDKLRKEYFE